MSRTHHHGGWRPWRITPAAKPWVRQRKHGGARRLTLTTPHWWIRLLMNKPKRHANKRLLRAVLYGADYDAMAFPLGNRKPHAYFY